MIEGEGPKQRRRRGDRLETNGKPNVIELAKAIRAELNQEAH